MQAPQVPMMVCAHCARPIEASRGYFSGWIGLKRSDFHPACKPQLTYAKEPRENLLSKAAEVGGSR